MQYVVNQGTAFEQTITVVRATDAEAANLRIMYRLNGEVDCMYARGETVDDAREALAARFPSADMLRILVLHNGPWGLRDVAIWKA